MRVKNGDTTLSSVIYPVFQNDIDVSKIKETECFVIVIDDELKTDEIEAYFSKNIFIKGKFSGETISDESMKILTDSGYKISKDCIVLTKGKNPWPLGTCFLMILGGAIALSLIVLSFIPEDKLIHMFSDKTIII